MRILNRTEQVLPKARGSPFRITLRDRNTPTRLFLRMVRCSGPSAKMPEASGKKKLGALLRNGES